LATLKAGGAYVPLDPAYPKERLAFMLEDAHLSVLLTQKRLHDELPATNARLVYVDASEAGWQGYPTTNPESPVKLDNLAYVIYTSGSTGKPKGVCIAHRALANLLHAMREHTAITEDDSLLAVTTLSFDIAALELYLPLIAGARVVLASREMAADGEALSHCLADRRITLMQATPATWRLLIEAGWPGDLKLHSLCGGEALSPELAQQLLGRCASLTNLYGPTETTIWSSAERVQANQPISIGRPLANTEIYILDAHLNLTPIGVPGELYIGGAGLARGYLNRPQLTAEKFVSHPFKAHARLYKTGDLARYRQDGQIEFLGRLDHQIKLRGYRIELGEIEATLVQHPQVREAAVLVREDHPQDQRLVAYVVPIDSSSPASADELRSFLKTLLPDYMLPSSFVALDQMPLTPNGKLDRKALPIPDQTRADFEESFVAPRTPNEEMLAAIWAEVLKLERVGIHDNFFDLGGHSLLATQIVSRTRKTFSVESSLRDLFEQPTVAGFAEAITRRQMNAVDPEELMKMLAELEYVSENADARARASSH
ncbi:MAG: non-ribosomal peptide synthetase, partial [Burkholderiales bacterium]